LIETLKNVTLPKVSSGLSKILVPIDESKPSIKALELAINLATRYESEICLVNIIPTYQLCHWLTVSGGIFCSDTMFVPSVIMRKMEKESKSLLISALILVQSAGIESYAIIGKGYPANEIVRIAKEEEVDLIVSGSNKPNVFVRLLFGSISQAVARKASCPVLIVKRRSQMKNKMINKIVFLSYLLFALSLMVLYLNKAVAIIVLVASFGTFLLGGLLRIPSNNDSQIKSGKKKEVKT